MQAEALARPGPEGGRIVYASRIPPRPLEVWRPGCLEAKRLGKGISDWQRETMGGHSKNASHAFRTFELFTPLELWRTGCLEAMRPRKGLYDRLRETIGGHSQTLPAMRQIVAIQQLNQEAS